MTSYFKRLQNKWNKLGQEDPLWAILSDNNKKNGGWKKAEFFKTGENEINNLIEYIHSFPLKLNSKRALDFGCGVGRLTQQLANYFSEVHGVDISQSLLKLADEYNKNPEKIFYHLNENSDLNSFSDNYFDFIYSNITLQHIKPEFSKKYLEEFLRILNSGGILIFQLPIPFKIRRISELTFTNLLVLGAEHSPRWLLDLLYPLIHFDMHGINQKEVVNLLEKNGAKIIDIKKDHCAGQNWISYRYCVIK